MSAHKSFLRRCLEETMADGGVYSTDDLVDGPARRAILAGVAARHAEKRRRYATPGRPRIKERTASQITESGRRELVRGALHTMLKSGAAERAGIGKYRLTEKGLASLGHPDQAPT